ncbi:MAG: pyridoxamine 5'-phosphate oxidase family protein [Actinomycetota bacterium]
MSSGHLDNLPAWARALLERERAGHLGLIDDGGHPRVLPVTFALAGGVLASVVDEKPKRTPGAELARVRWLRRRPAAALTVDRYDDDWSGLAWVQVLGLIDVVDVADHPRALAALEAKYAPYRERVPPGPLLLLRPHRALWWRADAGAE